MMLLWGVAGARSAGCRAPAADQGRTGPRSTRRRLVASSRPGLRTRYKVAHVTRSHIAGGPEPDHPLTSTSYWDYPTGTDSPSSRMT